MLCLGAISRFHFELIVLGTTDLDGRVALRKLDPAFQIAEIPTKMLAQHRKFHHDS